MAFKFIRTGTGELSGPSMIYQIEQGFDDTVAFVEEVHKTAEKAEATANKALEEATEATSVADVALKTAQDAQASAEAAQNRADEAWNAATGGGESAEAAMQRANAAYELADTANANALSAQSKTDAATAAAEEATTAASTATTAATEATATANEAISKAGTAEFAANQASSDVRMLKSIIDGLENAANEFEADSYTTSLDNLVSALVKKYMTGAITSALPDGVSAPFWFYNWSTSDLAKVFQFIQTNTGSYGRIGTPSGITMRDGEDTFYIQFKSGTSTSATSVAISCADNALTAVGQRGFTWTATSTPARGLVGTLAWDATTPDGTEITIGHRVVAAVTGGNVVVSDFSPSPSTNATLALTGGAITTSSTTLEISFVWTSLDASGCTWGAWNAMLGGTVATDDVTIRYNSASNLQAKDIAIGGNESDLASARGQIGDNIRINTASDLNAYTKAGNWLFSDAAAAGENFPNIGRGGELNCYVSTTAIFQFFTEFNNNRRYIRYGIPNSTWTNWIQFISVAQLGDGIRNTNGIISVPEYEGATASSAGTSGLVPPATARQHESFLTGGGVYKSALTKISDAINSTDSTVASSSKAVKSAYDRGSEGLSKATVAQSSADKALAVANTKQPNLGFTPVQQGGGTGQGANKVYIGWATDASGLKAQAGSTNLGNIVTTEGGTTKAPQAAFADRAEAANNATLANRANVATNADKLSVSGWGYTSWNSTPYGQSPLYVWCLPSGGSDMRPCSPGVLSAGAANFCTYTPNVRVGTDGSVLPAGGTWRIMTSRNGEGAIKDLAGGSAVSTAGGVFMAIRVA